MTHPLPSPDFGPASPEMRGPLSVNDLLGNEQERLLRGITEGLLDRSALAYLNNSELDRDDPRVYAAAGQMIATSAAVEERLDSEGMDAFDHAGQDTSFRGHEHEAKEVLARGIRRDADLHGVLDMSLSDGELLVDFGMQLNGLQQKVSRIEGQERLRSLDRSGTTQRLDAMFPERQRGRELSSEEQALYDKLSALQQEYMRAAYEPIVGRLRSLVEQAGPRTDEVKAKGTVAVQGAMSAGEVAKLTPEQVGLSFPEGTEPNIYVGHAALEYMDAKGVSALADLKKYVDLAAGLEAPWQYLNGVPEGDLHRALYKLIKDGLLHRNPDGTFETTSSRLARRHR